MRFATTYYRNNRHPLFILFLVLLSATSLRAQSVAYSVLYSFPQYVAGEPNNAQLLQGADGNFYGFTFSGVFFRISASGHFTKLFQTSESQLGPSPIVQGPDGNFYGTIPQQVGESGAIFRISPAGEFAIVQSLGQGGTDGTNAPGGLTLASDGWFYGSIATGGGDLSGCANLGCGELFRWNTDGEFQVIHTFSGGADGAFPQNLIEGSDGNLYGSTLAGGNASCAGEYNSDGVQGCGTVFRSSLTGNLTTIFDSAGVSETPVEGADGSLYGPQQGTDNDSVYRLDTAGQASTFVSLTPVPGLIPASDHDLYGVTPYDAVRLDLDGTITEQNFVSTNSGADRWLNTLIQGSDGNFYGTTYETGIYRFSLTPPLPAPVQLSVIPGTVVVGTPVTLSLKVTNAFSLTMQQCYGFLTNNGTVTPLGKVPGSYSATTQLYTDTLRFTPEVTGNYRYAVTCGGVESGLATLTVNGYPTTTALTASAGTVTPPGKVNLTATVTRTGSGVVPTGTVTFSYQALALGSAVLNGSGVATLQVSSQGVPAGTYPVTANYDGDGTDAASVSAATVVTVE